MIKKLLTVFTVFFINIPSAFSATFDVNQFNFDRSMCYQNQGNVECFQNLMTKYFYADKAYINLLRADCGIIYKNEKRYKEALLEFDYVIQNEKRNPKLIALVKEQRREVAELVQKIEDAKRNDFGDYYDQYNSARWENPGNIKVFINNSYGRSYGKSYTYKQAFETWETAMNGVIHFYFVDSAQDADIVCEIVDNIAPNVNGVTKYGNLTEKDGKKYFNKVYMQLSHINTMGAKNTDSIILTTALHEIGHALGIKYHSNSVNDIMYYEVHTYRTNTLSNRDINTLKRIYDVVY